MRRRRHATIVNVDTNKFFERAPGVFINLAMVKEIAFTDFSVKLSVVAGSRYTVREPYAGKLRELMGYEAPARLSFKVPMIEVPPVPITESTTGICSICRNFKSQCLWPCVFSTPSKH